MKDPIEIRNEILDKIEEYAGKIDGSPVENIPERMEQIRAIVQQHIDLLYADGHIDRKPTAIVEFNSKERSVDISFAWPVSHIEFTVNYSHNEGFKEVNE